MTLRRTGASAVFASYAARGPGHFDDGTVAPTAVGGSVAFAPGICIPTLRAMRRDHGADLYGRYGFLDALNPSFTDASVRLDPRPDRARARAGTTPTISASTRARSWR